MQKVAIHLQHFKRQQVAKLSAEGQRTIKNTLDNRIDFSQSRYNFQALTGERMNRHSYTQELKKICWANGITERKEGNKMIMRYENGRAIRTDANVMTGIVITLDRETVKAWGVEETKRYFKECSLFLRGVFGNCIDDVVHTDEEGAGWHLHFYASPIVNRKFNSKQMWNRQALFQLHDSLAEHLQGQGFLVERGESNTGKQYLDSYKDYKRELGRAIHNVEAVSNALADVKTRAVVHNDRAGVLGFGARSASVEMPLPSYQTLLKLAEQGEKATLELVQNRKRIEQSKKLQQTTEDNVILWSKAEEAEQETQQLKQKLADLPAKVIEEYEEKHKKILKAGYSLREALRQDKDFASKFAILYREYRERMQAQAKTRTTGRKNKKQWELDLN